MAEEVHQFDTEEEEKRKACDRAALRADLKKQYLLQTSNPFRYLEQGGHLSDPGVMRFMAMRATQVEHFRPTPKNTAFYLFGVLAPIIIYGYFIKIDRERKEANFRGGKISYKDRQFKFV